MKGLISRKWLLLLITTFVLVSCSSCLHMKTNSGFKVYLTVDITQLDRVNQIDLDRVELQSEPLFTVEDIIVYVRETHEIQLTESAMRKIRLLGPGQPFVICVGQERIYSGVFRSPLSSSITRGATIYLPLSDNTSTIRIYGLYVEGEDLRSDARIIKSLENAGKLK